MLLARSTARLLLNGRRQMELTARFLFSPLAKLGNGEALMGKGGAFRRTRAKPLVAAKPLLLGRRKRAERGEGPAGAKPPGGVLISQNKLNY